MSPAFIQVLPIALGLFICYIWILVDFWAVGSLEFEDVDRSSGGAFFI